MDYGLQEIRVDLKAGDLICWDLFVYLQCPLPPLQASAEALPPQAVKEADGLSADAAIVSISPVMNHKNKMRPIKKVWLDPYCIATILFAVWMLFLDDQNLLEQYRLYQRLQKLQADAIHYNFEIQQIRKEKKELAHNIDFLEKIAREKYYMKRKTEDLYIIVRE